jgi:1-pyrroline-5-carboxylate dehydrogenase
VETRVSLLLNAAEIIRSRKFEFCAWLTYEVGKNWAEADADVGETIDFLEFYAREALRLAAATTPIQYPGERNQLLYIPLGVGAVIPPWNFPFAIMAGMTAASIVTGNTVILKPSSDSPTIAAKFVEVLEEAGMPGGVVNFCPGSGATFGNAIVEHPKTRFIAFTGSKAVGLDIHERAARTSRARSGSSGPFSRWAARTRSWSAPMPIWTRPSKASSPRPSDSAGKSVPPAPAPSSKRRSTTCLSSACASASPNSPSAIRQPTTTWARSSTRPLSTPCSAYIETGKKEGRLIAGGNAPRLRRAATSSSPRSLPTSRPNAVLAQEEIFGPVLALIKVE